jgi:hypothetical protein
VKLAPALATLLIFAASPAVLASPLPRVASMDLSVPLEVPLMDACPLTAPVTSLPSTLLGLPAGWLVASVNGQQVACIDPFALYTD